MNRIVTIALLVIVSLTLVEGGRSYEKAPGRESLVSAPAGQAARPFQKPIEEIQTKGGGLREADAEVFNDRRYSGDTGGAGLLPGSLRSGEVNSAGGADGDNDGPGENSLAKDQSRESLRSRGSDRGGPHLYIDTYKITAYTAGPESTGKSPGHPAYGITASGVEVQEGRTVAADWAVLPPGTIIEIEGLTGLYVVEDTGGDITGLWLDLYIENVEDALAWGISYREVRVIEWGK